MCIKYEHLWIYAMGKLFENHDNYFMRPKILKCFKCQFRDDVFESKRMMTNVEWETKENITVLCL